MYDESNPLGLRADLQRLQWCAAQTRSRLSAENWRAVGVMQRQFQEASERSADPLETLDSLLLALAALAGFALDDMTQDDGWRLMMLGRRLERLQFLAELLGLRLEPGINPAQAELEWLLDIGDSTITYRTRYLASPALGSTLDLLVLDKTNPRALAHQWGQMHDSLIRIAASLGGMPDDTIDEAVAAVEQMDAALLDGDSPCAVRARRCLAARSRAVGRRWTIVGSALIEAFLAHRHRNAHGGRVSAAVSTGCGTRRCMAMAATWPIRISCCI